MEARIKVRYNYSDFIPASVCIKDENGNSFVVQVVTPENEKLLIESDIKIHGSI